MKTLFILLLTTQYLFSYSQREREPAVMRTTFKASITQINGTKATGYLAAVDDSSISLADKSPSYGFYSKERTNFIKVYYSGIEKVVIKRKGSTGRGLLNGAILGLIPGALLAVINGNDHPSNFVTTDTQSIILGITCTIGGAIAGGVAGSVTGTRFKIGGRKKRFDTMRVSMLDRMYGRERQ